MDSIGIDENHCPVIFEYKRSMKDNVINQGLFYLNWLLDHKDSFKVLVIEKLGLPKNSWPYAFSILGILLLVINIIKLISNIKWYRIFKSNESTETESL